MGDLHAALVDRAARWLAAKGCGVVITEMSSESPEHPDAIGWRCGHGTVIEVKVSRADFLADKKKWFRRTPGSAMGVHRYFMAPPGLLKAEEIPAPWGLLESNGRTVAVVKEAEWSKDSDRSFEARLLCSALRRMIRGDDGAVRGVRCKVYQFEGEGDPRATVGVAADGADQQQGGEGP